MAASINSSSSSSSDYLQLDSLPLIDLNSLSQSELNLLSLCSNDAFDFRHCDDLVIPKIDRSVFNESAGGRKQTYSRLRLAPRQTEIPSSGRRSRGAGGGGGVQVVPKNPVEESERKENHEQIVNVLRRLLGQGDPAIDLTAKNHERRGRKRGRKSKDRVLENETSKKNLDFLDVVDDPFGPELRKKTIGLGTDVELLGFLGGLKGRWANQRKKRKFVDASEFGDHLPQGWTLLLGLKRKQGRVSLYCRRYISSNGQQFASWKDVSSYLISLGPQNSHQLNPGHSDNSHRHCKLASWSISGHMPKIENRGEDLINSTASPNEATLLNAENLADTEVVSVLLECQKCNVRFHEKDAYLQHFMSCHQSAKVHFLGKSIFEYVMIRGGKYECRICHMIFLERQHFDEHFRVHVRNSAKSLQAPPCWTNGEKSFGSSSMSGVQYGFSKVDEPLENDKNSKIAAVELGNENDDGPRCTPSADCLLETSTDKSNHKQDVCSPIVQNVEVGSIVETSSQSNFQPNNGSPYGKSCDKQCSGGEMTDNRSKVSNEVGNDVGVKFTSFLDCATALSNEEETNISKTSIFKDILGSTTDGIDKSLLVKEADSASLPANDPNDDVRIRANHVLSMDSSKSQLNDAKVVNCVPVSALGYAHSKSDNMYFAKETDGRNDEKNVQGIVVADASLPKMQSSANFHSHHMAVGEEQDNHCNVIQKHGSKSAEETLRSEDKEVEPANKTDSAHTSSSRSFPEEPMPMDLAFNTDPEKKGLENLDQSDSEDFLPKMASRKEKEVSSVCIWCGKEFFEEVVKTEMRSDSVGFLCPMCKGKFSGLNVFG